MGGAHNKAIQIAFIYSASITVLFLSVVFPATIQGFADSLFSSFVPYAQFRLWLLDAVLLSIAFFASIWAIRGVHSHGYSEGMVDGQG